MSKDEIRLATRIKMIADMKDVKIMNKGLEFYTKFLLSNNRRSRREIIEAIKGYSTQPNLFQKMNPKNWGKSNRW